MNAAAEEIQRAGSFYCLSLTRIFAAIAFLLTGFFAPAQAQYYFLPDLPVYWGPYPPKFVYVEPHEFVPGKRSHYRRNSYKRRYSSISIHAIEDELARQGYHLIAAVRRKGNRFLCVAADAEGHRQRFIYDAFTGKLITRVWIGSDASEPPSNKLSPAQTQNPSQPENNGLTKKPSPEDLPRAERSLPAAPTPSLPDSQTHPSAIPMAKPPLNPSEPVSTKPDSADQPFPQQGQI